MPKAALLLLCLPLLLFACKHEHDHQHTDPADTEQPVVNLLSPSADQTSFSNGEVIRIMGSTTDNRQLHEVHIELINESAAPTQSPYLIHHHLHPQGNTASFDTSFTVATAAPAVYRVRIRADDAAGNTGGADRVLQINQ